MLSGTTPYEQFLDRAATLHDFGTEQASFPQASIFQALFEMRVAGRQLSLPPALHPTNPPTFVLQVWDCPESSWGRFRLAQARVGCRSGLRPRGFVQGAVCDNAAAAEALRTRWGFPVVSGNVQVLQRYDAVSIVVRVDDATACDLSAVKPEPLGADDVSYSATVALARTPRGVRLVQIDADVAVDRAERLVPRLTMFDGARFGVHPSVDPYHPASASMVRGTLTVERLRFVCRPDELAFSGTETV